MESIPIKGTESVFELGCGTGAALKRLKQVYGDQLQVGGSDISSNAIEFARKLFPGNRDNFNVISMTETNDLIGDQSQDIVVSFGAFAMYLYEDDMELALQEALRVAKSAANICLSHFIEPQGQFLGTILQPIAKVQWKKWAARYSLQNLKIQQMVHQQDRYYVCFSKGRA